MYNRITITEDNFIGVAMKFYDNAQCNTVDEFEQDLYRIVCIKKIIDRYRASGKVNIRLLLNHVIVLHNAFDRLVPDMLRVRLSENHLPVLKPILVFLKYIESDYWNDVIEDSKIFNTLREIG